MKIKKYANIIWVVVFIGICLWFTEGDIINVFAAFGETVLKTIGCVILFSIICILFPKSWFAKIFNFSTHDMFAKQEDNKTKINNIKIEKQAKKYGYPHEYILNIIDSYENMFNSLVFNYIIKDSKEYIKQNKNIVNENKSYYNSDKSLDVKAIEQMVVSVIRNVLDRKLTSGEFHIYCGVLNEQGQELLRIYKQISKELIRLEMQDENTKEYINEDWVNRNINSLLEDIKMAG